MYSWGTFETLHPALFEKEITLFVVAHNCHFSEEEYVYGTIGFAKVV